MTDLSKCTELVNGWPIVYGPERTGTVLFNPWQCVAKDDNGDLRIVSHCDKGAHRDGEGPSQFDLKLPEPEWVYGRPYTFQSGGRTYRGLIECKPEKATHRYQAGDPTTMEEVEYE